MENHQEETSGAREDSDENVLARFLLVAAHGGQYSWAMLGNEGFPWVYRAISYPGWGILCKLA